MTRAELDAGRCVLCLTNLRAAVPPRRQSWHAWLDGLLAKGARMPNPIETNPIETPVSFYSIDTPLGPLMVMECRWPDSEAQRPDVPTHRMCPVHHRSVYVCLDREVLWCDGYVGQDTYFPHECDLVAARMLDEDYERIRAADPEARRWWPPSRPKQNASFSTAIEDES